MCVCNLTVNVLLLCHFLIILVFYPTTVYHKPSYCDGLSSFPPLTELPTVKQCFNVAENLFSPVSRNLEGNH